VLHESRRVRTQIDDDILWGSHRAANEFRLFVRGLLVMHPPQDVFRAVEGDVALYPMSAKAVRLKLALAPGARKKATFIF
jgi:hypothetical protein